MAAAKKKNTKQSGPTQAPNMQAFVEPTVRIFTRWSPALIRQAAIQADAGYIRQAADICDWLLADDRVSSTLRTRIQQLFGLEPNFEKSGDRRRSGRAIRALEVEEDWWEAYPESELMQLHTWGLLLGVKPARHAGWPRSEEHGGRVLPIFSCWHPQHLRYDNANRAWKIKVARQGSGDSLFEEEDLDPGNGEWILHMPFGSNRPWSLGLWRALAPLVLLKDYARQDWAKISERGVLLVLTCLDASASENFQKSYTKETRAQLANDIYSRGSEAVAALPPGIDLKTVSAAVNSNDVQGALIKMADEAIAIVVRGGNLTTSVAKQTGSKQATSAQADLGDGGNLKFDAQAITTTIHGQSLVWWAQFNFGDKSLAPWPVYPVDEDEDLKTKTEAEGKAFENLDVAERLGFDVDRGKFLEEHRISWAEAGERDDEKAPLPNTWTLPSKPAEPGANPFGAQPVPPPAGATGPNGEPAKGKPGEKPADPNAPQARPVEPPQPKRDIAEIELRSGAPAKKNSGFIAGQLYVDDVGDAAAKHASGHMAKMVAEVANIIDRATSYEGLRKDIRAYYGKRAKPHELADLVEKAMTLAQLGGSAAVLEDVPELEK